MRILEKKYTEDYSLKLVSYYQPLADNGWYEHSEIETQNWVLQNVGKDWIILDCGAHIGYYSMLFSHCAPQGKVYAFEPCPLTCQYFADNVRVNRTLENPYSNIELVQTAIGDEVSVAKEETLWFSGQNEDGFGKTKGTFTFMTIDAYCNGHSINRLDLIKSDVDGWDYELLLGARETIERFKPIIIAEVNYALGWRKHSAEEVKDFLQEIGYSYSVLDAVVPNNWLLQPKAEG